MSRNLDQRLEALERAAATTTAARSDARRQLFDQLEQLSERGPYGDGASDIELIAARQYDDLVTRWEQLEDPAESERTRLGYCLIIEWEARLRGVTFDEALEQIIEEIETSQQRINE